MPGAGSEKHDICHVKDMMDISCIWARFVVYLKLGQLAFLLVERRWLEYESVGPTEYECKVVCVFQSENPTRGA